MVPLAMLTVVLAQAPAQSAASEELAAAARAVFATKCVQCHGPDVPHPKAAFGFITDLRRLVASGKYIVPGKPGESEIWKEISEGDMPPDEAKAGPLTAAETEAIRAWIEAGAPPPAEGAVEGARGFAPAAGAPSQADPESLPRRVLSLLGRAHVIVVHFPLAMLISAALAELWAVVRGMQPRLATVRFCLWVGSLGALGAGVLGWVHALDGFPSPTANPLTVAGLHRWIGTVAAVLAPGAALLVERDYRLGRRTALARGAILALAAVAGIAGHFGGLLTHGPGFFDP